MLPAPLTLSRAGRPYLSTMYNPDPIGQNKNTSKKAFVLIVPDLVSNATVQVELPAGGPEKPRYKDRRASGEKMLMPTRMPSPPHTSETSLWAIKLLLAKKYRSNKSKSTSATPSTASIATSNYTLTNSDRYIFMHLTTYYYLSRHALNSSNAVDYLLLPY